MKPYVRFPPSLRYVEDLLHKRGDEICHETVRFWWHRFGPMFVIEMRAGAAYAHSIKALDLMGDGTAT